MVRCERCVGTREEHAPGRPFRPLLLAALAVGGGERVRLEVFFPPGAEGASLSLWADVGFFPPMNKCKGLVGGKAKRW